MLSTKWLLLGVLNYPSGDLRSSVTSARTPLSSLQLMELGERGKGILYIVLLIMETLIMNDNFSRSKVAITFTNLLYRQ